MTGVPADQLVLHGVELDGADFSGRDLKHVSIANGSRLTRCDFSRAKFTGGSIGGGYETSTFVECLFDRCVAKDLMPGRGTFVNCSFRDVRLRNFFCHEAQFVDCTFTGRIRKAIFSAQPSNTTNLGRDKNEYHGNDFSGARLEDTAFRGGIDLDLQRLPEGPEYLIVRDASDVLARVAEDVEAWPEEELRKNARILLGVLGSDVAGGQRDLFVNREFLGAAADRLGALLSTP
ncbi:hypothetical protein LWC34_17510 [Kibdelosporangium philippinense]|uniref:Pentapeptide repeat-containing protein n=1 Tax=Kibdelosporangium philippinense TaxID=211113 RepID=A0ABS8ZDK9_9PSEU|nr:hypothetical protein [Kibdelosporangium philippinense]MCE7004608.1 hypothetical protein [Kibdelosporangium philippinense]